MLSVPCWPRFCCFFSPPAQPILPRQRRKIRPKRRPAGGGEDRSAETSAVSSAGQTEDTSSGLPIDTSGLFQPPCDCYDSIPTLLRDPDPQLVPPGTPPAVIRVPELTDPDVGKTRTLDLTPSCDLAMLHFTYVRSEATGKERFTVVETHDLGHSLRCATLSVYETGFGGGEGLYRALTDGTCRAKLLARTYITEQESTSVGISDCEPGEPGCFKADEFVGGAEQAVGSRFFGTIRFPDRLETSSFAYQTLPDGRCLALVRQLPDGGSGEANHLLTYWQNIYDRFDKRCGLNALVSVE